MATDERSDTPSTDAADSWAEVLAAVEADIRRTEDLLATPGSSAAPTPAAPAQAMLPGPFRQFADASWAELPAFDAMPPVPVELTNRIHELRAQIVALQAEITSEMAHWRTSNAGGHPIMPPTTTADSYYVDRLA